MTNMDWVRKWLKRAKEDLLAAHRVMEGYHPKLLEVCCYQCQQAGEKALKAFLTLQERTFPFTHDLRTLCQICAEYDERFDNFADDCSILSPYAIRARYPADDDMEEAEAQAALRKAERIVAFCASLIPPVPPADAE